VLASEPDGEPSIHQAYVLAIASAKTSIPITCAYFIPDPQLLIALTAAAQRGVDAKDELNIVVDDDVLGQAMEQAFQEDLRLSKEVSADAWHKRSALDKVKEWAARRLEYWL
jgi:cardiolipin synthase